MKYILISIFILFFVTANSQHGNNANFNGEDDNSYIDFGAGSSLNGIDTLPNGDKLSISLWAKWGDKTFAGSYANLFTLNSASSGDNGVFWVQHNGDKSAFEFKVTTINGTRFCTSTTNPNEGEWYHLALIYDGSNVKIYVNGVLESSNGKSGNIAAFPADAELFMGRWSASSARRFDGNIDEVSIWNVALTTTQINDIKTNAETVTGINHDAEGLIGYWDFNDGTANDLTASNNNGVIGTGATLPIELIDFNAEINNNSVELNWATATELNNDYFIIERATDISTENSNWNQIDQTSGAGTTNTISEYILIDNDIDANEETYYYRLKQVDYDGKFTYSDIVAVSIKISKEISVYPNPSIGIFKVSGLSDNTYNSVEVYNSVGQMIMKTEGTQELVIDITDQASGFYFIKSGTSSIRVIKQ